MGITRTQNGTILNGNGRNSNREPKPFEEVGTPGLEMYSGFIQKAYTRDLFWPNVEPVYSRIWRSDPEVTIMRTAFESWASSLDVTIDLPEQRGGMELGEPTDDDKRAQQFGYAVLDDIEGGIGQWVTSVTTRSPFYGWGFWEAPLGLRKPNWKPPNEGDEWRSEYDDGLVGIRRLAFRDYSSFEQWEANDQNGRVTGLWQSDPPNVPQLLPFKNGLHITYGDADNPEGLATLEAIWRLERIKYGLEVVMGIGFEHAAGYLDVKASIKPTNDDKAAVRRAARAIMTAQEGNFALWPENFTGEVKDTNFQAAQALLEAIRYYSILKLSLMGMQFVAQSGISNTGTYGAQMDGSNMAILLFNSMVGGFEQQINDQLIKRLYTHPINAAAFPNATRRPYLKIGRLDKTVQLDQLSQFVMAMNAVMPLGDDDFIAIRRKSELLPETLPETERNPVPEPEPDTTPEPEDDLTPEEQTAVEEVRSQDNEDGEMSSQRWWELRAKLYRKPLGNDELVHLVDMLDNATTEADLDKVSEAMNGQ